MTASPDGLPRQRAGADASAGPPAAAAGVQGQLLWSASEQRVRAAHMTRFRERLQREWQVSLPDYGALHAFSVDRVDDFWRSLWHYAGIVGDWDGAAVREPGATMAEDRWFPGARLNFAENLLLPAQDLAEALVARDEAGGRRVLSGSDLLREVARMQGALAAFGVRAGDRVVGYLPNVPEAVVAMLAASALGAVWAVVAPDLSAQAAADRIGQLDPVVLVTADGVRHAGRVHGLLDKARTVAAAMPNLRAAIVVQQLPQAPDLAGWPAARAWSDVLAGRDEREPHYRRLPFDAPAFVMFTSGTTGKPKCLVHGMGGPLLQFAKEHLLHADIRTGDRLFRFTSTGWMMWNWSVGALARGATVVLYDGAPLFPGTQTLFDLAAQERLTFFSPSAALLDAYVQAGLDPARTHDLSALRTMYSGGMRVPASHYAWVYRQVKRDLFFASPSGGTDPMAAFVAGDPAGQVRAGEIPCASLGMRMELLDDAGVSLERGPGEFVCASPFPSIPLAFWGDPDRTRLLESYFARYPGKWAHGDWVERSPAGGYIIHGRSDATLKVRGLRIGTAEIYGPLEAVAEIAECAAVEQRLGDGSQMLLFVRLAEGAVLDEALCARIRRRLREAASPHHVPARIAAVPELPRSHVGKVLELAIADVVNGRPPRNLAVLANPQSLAHFQPFVQGEAPCVT